MISMLSKRPTDLEVIQLGQACIVDIEATALKADRGRVLCVSIKPVTPPQARRKGLAKHWKPVTFRIDDPRNKGGRFNDKWVIEQTVRELDSYDLVVGWYSSRYDIPMLNTRAIKHGLKPPARNFRRDLLFNARGSLNLSSNRLANVGRYLYGSSGKSFLDWDIWDRASRGDRKALDYIVEHCEKDVIETEKIYMDFLPILGRLRRG